MLIEVEDFTREFLEKSENKPIRIVSHYDTDGITSAAILARTLQRLDKKFTINIVKGLDEEIIKKELNRNKKEIIIFSDLASNSLNYFNNLENPVFILDHHEINIKEINKPNLRILNPHLTKEPEDNNCTGAGVCYLFSKQISKENKDLAKIAIIGLIGDRQENNLSKINQQIINDCEELNTKKGIILYPATRPLRRTLEYSTSPYIPGVTGNQQGVIELLRETGIDYEKSLLDLNTQEMSNLITGILLRKAKKSNSDDVLGNLYILKFFNTQEDVREISTLINACSRLGFSDIALSYCLENKNAKNQALDIYTRYKQELVSGLKIAEKMEKINGKNFVILNAKDQIKDAIIGTICSMLSSSPIYKEGTILIGMAYNENKIKVSARIAGRQGRNLKELMEQTIIEFKKENPNSLAEVGGHNMAAGCLIEKENENTFLEKLKKNLEIEIIKV
ncbi:MAG: DHH family phosphoesterase [Candidatus Pacearchaeota archaeon]